MTIVDFEEKKMCKKIDDLKNAILLLHEQYEAITKENKNIRNTFVSISNEIEHLYEGIELLMDRVDNLGEQIFKEAH